MKTLGERVFYSMVVGIAVTAPFYALEYYYSGGYPQGVPEALFRMMWIESTLFTILTFSLLRTQFTNAVGIWIIPFMLKLAAMFAIAIAWITIVIDQMPCFFGGRGC